MSSRESQKDVFVGKDATTAIGIAKKFSIVYVEGYIGCKW